MQNVVKRCFGSILTYVFMKSLPWSSKRIKNEFAEMVWLVWSLFWERDHPKKRPLKMVPKLHGMGTICWHWRALIASYWLASEGWSSWRCRISSRKQGREAHTWGEVLHFKADSFLQKRDHARSTNLITCCCSKEVNCIKHKQNKFIVHLGMKRASSLLATQTRHTRNLK